jgi:hypothetical protein
MTSEKSEKNKPEFELAHWLVTGLCNVLERARKLQNEKDADASAARRDDGPSVS